MNQRRVFDWENLVRAEHTQRMHEVISKREREKERDRREAAGKGSITEFYIRVFFSESLAWIKHNSFGVNESSDPKKSYDHCRILCLRYLSSSFPVKVSSEFDSIVLFLNRIMRNCLIWLCVFVRSSTSLADIIYTCIRENWFALTRCRVFRCRKGTVDRRCSLNSNEATR